MSDKEDDLIVTWRRRRKGSGTKEEEGVAAAAAAAAAAGEGLDHRIVVLPEEKGKGEDGGEGGSIQVKYGGRERGRVKMENVPVCPGGMVEFNGVK